MGVVDKTIAQKPVENPELTLLTVSENNLNRNNL